MFVENLGREIWATIACGKPWEATNYKERRDHNINKKKKKSDPEPLKAGRGEKGRGRGRKRRGGRREWRGKGNGRAGGSRGRAPYCPSLPISSFLPETH